VSDPRKCYGAHLLLRDRKSAPRFTRAWHASDRQACKARTSSQAATESSNIRIPACNGATKPSSHKLECDASLCDPSGQCVRHVVTACCSVPWLPTPHHSSAKQVRQSSLCAVEELWRLVLQARMWGTETHCCSCSGSTSLTVTACSMPPQSCALSLYSSLESP
jgi:hypothetical protein